MRFLPISWDTKVTSIFEAWELDIYSTNNLVPLSLMSKHSQRINLCRRKGKGEDGYLQTYIAKNSEKKGSSDGDVIAFMT